MKPFHNPLILVVGLFLVLTNCSSEDSNIEYPDSGSGTQDATSSIPDSGLSDSRQTSPDASSGEVTALEGDWRASCTQEHPFQFDIQFRGSAYKQAIGLASAAPCNITSVLEIRTSFVVSAESTLPVETSYDVDLGTDDAIATVRSGAAFFNTISLCGKNDWIVGEDVPNIATLCDNWLTYELFAIEGGNLFIGEADTGNGTTPSTRPTALDPTPFLRVNP